VTAKTWKKTVAFKRPVFCDHFRSGCNKGQDSHYRQNLGKGGFWSLDYGRM